jgi:hypothetical protein
MARCAVDGKDLIAVRVLIRIESDVAGYAVQRAMFGSSKLGGIDKQRDFDPVTLQGHGVVVVAHETIVRI